MVKAKLCAVTYANCPNCGNAEAFKLHDQILACGYFHGWSCDVCHHVYNGQVINDEWVLDHKGENKPTLVLLSLPPQTKPVYFVIESAIYRHSAPLGSAEQEENNRYFFEESTCPTNCIRCEEILNEEHGRYSGDNHGLLRYVGEVDAKVLVENPCPGNYMKAFCHLVPDLKLACEDLGVLDD